MEICSLLSMIRSVLKEELFSEQIFFLYFLREIFSEKTQTVTLQQAICGQMGNVLHETLESYGDLSSWSDMQVLAFEFPDQCSVEIEYFVSLGGVRYRYLCHVDYQDKKIRSHFIHNDTVYSTRGDKVLTLSDSYSNETRLVVTAKESACNNMKDVVYDAKALKTFSDRSRPYLSPAKAEMRKLYEQKRNELEERKVSKRLSDQKRDPERDKEEGRQKMKRLSGRVTDQKRDPERNELEERKVSKRLSDQKRDPKRNELEVRKVVRRLFDQKRDPERNKEEERKAMQTGRQTGYHTDRQKGR